MGAQVVGVCVYGAWGLALSLVLFGALKRSRIVWWARMKKAEQDGLDLSLFTREELVERFEAGESLKVHVLQIMGKLIDLGIECIQATVGTPEQIARGCQSEREYDADTDCKRHGPCS